MTDTLITRRELLLTTGTLALIAMTSSAGAAGEPAAGAPAGEPAAGEPAGAPTACPSGPQSLAFLDCLLSAQELRVGQRELAPLTADVLQLDLVWQWRTQLHTRMAQGAQLIAITRWDKALLLRELAREARVPLRQQRIARSLFRTELGAGAAG